eukprot:COSAG03_NODE_386_length_8314_cov_5.931589_14_plen_96_part_00
MVCVCVGGGVTTAGCTHHAVAPHLWRLAVNHPHFCRSVCQACGQHAAHCQRECECLCVCVCLSLSVCVVSLSVYLCVCLSLSLCAGGASSRSGVL